jgi:hypothetical protein
VIDASVLVREYLLGQSAVTTLLGTNANGSIYCSFDLPEHFDPTLGPAIQIFRSGGHSHTEITALVDARLQIRVWADTEKYTVAADVYAAIHDALHGLCDTTVEDGTIVRSLETTGPSEFTDPDEGWVAVFAFYSILARPNGVSSPSAYTPQFYEGSGAPVVQHNSGDVYYDEATGNLYAQAGSAWLQIANIPVGGGGGDEMPSTPFHLVAASGTNSHNVKPGAGVLTGWFMSNDTEYAVYVKLYDKASTPNVGVDVPAQTIQVQAGQPVPFPFGSGITYSNGIGIAITKGMSDGDATPVAAGDCVVDLFYQ